MENVERADGEEKTKALGGGHDQEGGGVCQCEGLDFEIPLLDSGFSPKPNCKAVHDQGYAAES